MDYFIQIAGQIVGSMIGATVIIACTWKLITKSINDRVEAEILKRWVEYRIDGE